MDCGSRIRNGRAGEVHLGLDIVPELEVLYHHTRKLSGSGRIRIVSASANSQR